MSEPFSEIGTGLTVVIAANDISHSADWRSFALWWSLQKLWPDSRFMVSLPKGTFRTPLFRWLDRCKVRRVRHADGDVRSVVLAQKNGGLKGSLLGLSHRLLINRRPTADETMLIGQGREVTDGQGRLFYAGVGIADTVIPTLCGGLDEEGDPMFVEVGDVVAGFDCTKWESKMRTAPFGVTVEAEGKPRRVIDLWAAMFNYYAMVAR